MMEFHPYSRTLPRENGSLFRAHAPVATTQPPPLYAVPPSPAYGTPYGESYRYSQPQIQQQQQPRLHPQAQLQQQPQLQIPQQQQQPQPQPQLQRQQLSAHSPVTPFPGPYQFPPVNHGSVHPSQRHSRSLSSPNQARLQRVGFKDHPSASPTMSHPQRQMPPPPSPPQHYPSRSQSTNPPALSNPVYHTQQQQQQSGNPVHRPGSSMSISAMLGSDTDRPSRDIGSTSLFSRPPAASSSSPSPFGSAPPATTTPGGMSPPTGPARPSSLDYPLFRRSQTPEKSLSRNQHPPPRPYRSSSGGVSHASLTGPLSSSSRAPPPPGSSAQFPEKPSPPISSADTAYNESRRLSLNGSGSIPRPSSQPLQVEQPRPSGYSPLSRTAPAPAPAPEDSAPFGAAQHRPSYLEHGRYSYADRQLEEQREKERMESRNPYGERRHPSAGAWDLSRSQPPSPESKRFPASESGQGFGFGAIQSYTKSLGSQPGGSRPPSLESAAQQSRPEQATFPPSGEQGPYLPKHQAEPPRLTGSGPSTTGPALYSDDKRKGSDELMQHRSLLGVGANEKRGGRLSPLPQAVQGALGPGGESTIKNDLGRVFSGIGSGVGGVTAPTAGSGHSTPLAVSPFKRDSGISRSANGDSTDETRNITRPGSTMGKRGRRSQDDLQFMENDIEQRTGMSRGRRVRPHHHHHHHHHHHRSKEEEAAAAALGSHRPPFYQRTSTGSAENGHHHHHHHHPHHHHHHHHHHHRHSSRTSDSAPVEPMRETQTVVNIEPVRSSVAHLPRYHLGSTLYAPRIGMPATHASMESAKFGYTSTPQPLPRFEGKANCTFTVRVPRYRIDAARREEICARRALWGTGIYTDDSDPVAAAIHSGYLRGSWGDDVDESILDLEIKDTYQHAPPPSAEERESDQPRLPPVPPRDKDAHITLLILPKLEQYDSTVLFGIKSRTWDSSHDGMSFQILRVDWVEEGAGRGEERGGEARRKRLRNLMQSGRICTGPASINIEDLRRGHSKPPPAPAMASAQPV